MVGRHAGDPVEPEIEGEFNPLLDDEDEELILGGLPELDDFALPSMDEPMAYGEPVGGIVGGGSGSKPGLEFEDSMGVLSPEVELDDVIPEFEVMADLITQLGLEGGGLFDAVVAEEPEEVYADLQAAILGDSSVEEEDPLAGFRLDEVLSAGFAAGASDVDVIAGDEVSFEILGDEVRQPQFGIVGSEVTQRLQLSIISHVLQSDFVEQLELDASYVLRTGPHAGRRTRLSVGKSFGEVFLVFRLISDVIPKLADLAVPKLLEEWCSVPNGLVMICGTTGSGKSTTFASMIHHIQLTQKKKIITIEKPIEYVYPKGVGPAVIVQRQVGPDARSFAGALKSAMRQHPKIIMVGEVRDQEEIDEALRASDSGHLTLTTMHTTSPAGTIARITALYKGDEQLKILASLKSNLRGIANQTLVKAVDGKSRSAVYSLLSMTPEVLDLVGRGDAAGLEDVMRRDGLTMEHSLVAAVLDGRCTLEEAFSHSAHPDFFRQVAAEAGL